jgi:hypothetical protein
MEQIFYNFFEAISPALQVLLEAVLVALAVMLTAWVKARYGEVRAQMHTEHQYILDLVVSTAVRAAEQVYDDGAEKRNYAMGIAAKQLNQYGVRVDFELLAAAVEAAVYSNFQKDEPEG